MNKTVDVVARCAQPTDEARWRPLWTAYNDFYLAHVPESATTATWQRILDPESPVTGRVAVRDDVLVGFSVSIVHHTTWAEEPVCYLEDLFVDPTARRLGVGRRLISDLIEIAHVQNYSGLYWHTKQDNPARHLYDEFVTADEFVRYRLNL